MITNKWRQFGAIWTAWVESDVIAPENLLLVISKEEK